MLTITFAHAGAHNAFLGHALRLWHAADDAGDTALAAALAGLMEDAGGMESDVPLYPYTRELSGDALPVARDLVLAALPDYAGQIALAGEAMTLAEYSRHVNAGLAWEGERPVFAGDLIPWHEAGFSPAFAVAETLRERDHHRHSLEG